MQTLSLALASARARTLQAIPSWLLAALTAAPFPLLVLAVWTVAVAVRAQYLTDIPRYTDEINEILPAFDIVRGTRFPLMSGPKHLGALFDYVLAGAMFVFGRSPDLPRTVVFVTGLLTMLLAYGYARSLAGRWAGLLAAALLAVSAPHVLLSSRVAWSASLTPLLGLGAAWALDRALSQRRPWLLVVAGFLAGLALQAHPSFAALLPGFAIFVLFSARRLIRQPQTYLAGVAFVAAFSNVLLYNWQSGLGGVRSVNQQYPGEGLGGSVYVQNFWAPVHGLLLTLASAVDATRLPSITDPFVVFVGALSLLALVVVARRVTSLPLLVVLSAVLLLPLVHDKFDPPLKARYLMPLVPLIHVAMAVFLVRAVRQSVWRHAVALGMVLVVLVGSFGSLVRYESTMLAADCTNRPQRAFIAELERQSRPDEWILLDEGVLPPAERLGYLTLLELSSKRVGETSLQRQGARTELDERSSYLTAVSDGKAVQVFEKQRLPLLPQTVAAVHPALREPGADGRRPMQGIGLYRVTTEGAALLYHDAAPGCGDLRTN